MKFDVYDIGKVYKDYFSIQQNQIEIMQQMRAEMMGYTELVNFKGEAATNAKSYISDVHITVVDSFDMALMEMEIRLLTLKQDFNATVDSDADAVVNDSYIDQIADDINGYIIDAGSKEQSIESLISSISDIVPLGKPPISDYKDKLKATEDNALDTVQKMHDFELRHAGDMDNVNEMLWAIRSATSYIGDFGGISSYVPQSAAETDWSKRLFSCQINSYFYAVAADPDFYDTIYVDFAVQTGLTMLEALIPADADMSVVMDLLKNGDLNLSDLMDAFSGIKDMSKATQEAIQLVRFFRDGIRFVTSVNEDGEAVIKAVSVMGKALTRSQQVAALRSVGIADDVERATARGLAKSLFSAKGLELAALQNGAVDAKSVAALTAAIKAGEDSSSFLKAFSKELKGVSKTEWILFGITIAIDVTDGFYDERTRSFSEFDGVEFAANATVDTVSFLAPIAAGAGAGLLWGSAVPGIGNLVGAGMGVIVAGLTLITWGEPPRSVTDRASDWIEGAIHDVGNWFSKVFW